jgi:hypothetical protein
MPTHLVTEVPPKALVHAWAFVLGLVRLAPPILSIDVVPGRLGYMVQKGRAGLSTGSRVDHRIKG